MAQHQYLWLLDTKMLWRFQNAETVHSSLYITAVNSNMYSGQLRNVLLLTVCSGMVMPIEEGRAQVKILIEHLAIFFIFLSKKLLPISFKFQLLETSPQKQKEQ
jgi:hypothetical protein